MAQIMEKMDSWMGRDEHKPLPRAAATSRVLQLLVIRRLIKNVVPGKGLKN